MRMYEIIEKKREKKELTKDEKHCTKQLSLHYPLKEKKPSVKRALFAVCCFSCQTVISPAMFFAICVRTAFVSE